MQVSAWMVVEQDTADGRAEINADDPAFVYKNAHIWLTIQNATDEPVSDVWTRIPGFKEGEARNGRLSPAEFEDVTNVVAPETLNSR